MSRKTQTPPAATPTGTAKPGAERAAPQGVHPSEEFYKAHEVHTLVQLTLQQLATSWNGAPMPWVAPMTEMSPGLMGSFGMGWPSPQGVFNGNPAFRGMPQPVNYWYP